MCSQAETHVIDDSFLVNETVAKFIGKEQSNVEDVQNIFVGGGNSSQEGKVKVGRRKSATAEDLFTSLEERALSSRRSFRRAQSSFKSAARSTAAGLTDLDEDEEGSRVAVEAGTEREREVAEEGVENRDGGVGEGGETDGSGDEGGGKDGGGVVGGATDRSDTIY